MQLPARVALSGDVVRLKDKKVTPYINLKNLLYLSKTDISCLNSRLSVSSHVKG